MEEKVVLVAATAKTIVNPMEQIAPREGAPVITIKKLLEAGCHFGHPTKRWNPKMAPYIYTARNGIYIVDLVKTVGYITQAYNALKKISDNGGKVLFVGTKKQIKDIVAEEATRSGSFYVTQRWLGGILTNFRTIQKRIKRLKDIEKMAEDGTFEVLPKKEVLLIKKEGERLEKFFSGIKEMRKLPNAVFVIDPKIEHNAVLEAKKLGIPVFAIVDTNSDPDLVDYLIPANDDAVRSVKVITAVISDAVCESKNGVLTIAYTPDEGDEVTMTEVIKNADKQAEAKKQARENKENQYKDRGYDNKKRYNNYNKDYNKDYRKPKEEAPAAQSTSAPTIEKKGE